MDGLVLKEIPLDRERLSIGRKPHNDIQIDNLAISGEHAVIVTILEDSFLEDLNSTNGTLVNGQPVKKHFLRHNDVIELGKYKLKYLNDPAEREAARLTRSNFEPTAGGPTASDGFSSFGPATSRNSPAKARLIIQNGVNAGKELPLTKDSTSLGKPGVQVASIERRAEGHFLRHVEGAERPRLNGLPLAGELQPLRDGDRIEIFGIEMQFVQQG
jgi:pSer/pThr/pTyr-binding forkhead associated (FHA) protein